MNLVEDLVSEYIKNPASIILLTVPCESELKSRFHITSGFNASFQPTTVTKRRPSSSENMIRTGPGQSVGSPDADVAHFFCGLIGVNGTAIGILTKPDRMAAGTEPGWLDYFLGKTVPLKHGWFCIRRPDFNEMQAGMTRDEALEKEKETFSTHAPWNTLGTDEKERLGLTSLRQHVFKVHAQAISEKSAHSFRSSSRTTNAC